LEQAEPFKYVTVDQQDKSYLIEENSYLKTENKHIKDMIEQEVKSAIVSL
jgi:regulator of replication initiation timing